MQHFTHMKDAAGCRATAEMWEKLKEATRHRDEALQGDINPVLADFGEETEAKQYSGRLVEPDWHPPFSPHPGKPGAGLDLIPTLEAPARRGPLDHEGTRSEGIG